MNLLPSPSGNTEVLIAEFFTFRDLMLGLCAGWSVGLVGWLWLLQCNSWKYCSTNGGSTSTSSLLAHYILCNIIWNPATLLSFWLLLAWGFSTTWTHQGFQLVSSRAKAKPLISSLESRMEQPGIQICTQKNSCDGPTQWIHITLLTLYRSDE